MAAREAELHIGGKRGVGSIPVACNACGAAGGGRQAKEFFGRIEPEFWSKLIDKISNKT